MCTNTAPKARAYCATIREHAIDLLIDEHMSIADVARMLHVTPQTVAAWKAQYMSVSTDF